MTVYHSIFNDVLKILDQRFSTF